MKKLSIIHFLGLALFAMTFNACVEDPVDGTGGGGTLTSSPELSLVDEAGFIAFNETVSSGAFFNVKVSVTKGDSPLNAFFLQEDGLEIAPARYLVDGADSGANPKLILGGDKEGLTWDLTILAHESGTKTYRFLVEDEAGESSSQSIDITTDGGTPPTVVIGGSGMPSGTPGGLVTIPITVGQGTFALASISVYENDVLIDDFANRLYFNDVNVPFDGNPYILPASAQAGFDGDIYVRAADAAGVNTYRVELADEIGNITGSEFTISTGTVGSPVTSIQGVLFNAAGPIGTGGLDLDTGTGTGSSDVTAEIKDEGIDGGVANEINWIKRISGVGTTQIKFVLANLDQIPESFTFDGITVSEEIPNLFDGGTPVEDLNSDNELISYLIEVGDVYAVRSATKDYLIIIREVNETPDNNGDNYVIDIKF